MNLKIVSILSGLKFKSVEDQGHRIFMTVDQQSPADPSYVSIQKFPMHVGGYANAVKVIYLTWADSATDEVHNLLGPARIAYSQKSGAVLRKEYAIHGLFFSYYGWCRQLGNT